MDRRQFITTLAAAGASCVVARSSGGAMEKPGPYKRASTDWLAKCRYGVGVHWTAQTVPRHGSPLPFQKAVDVFDVKKFVDQLTYADADYLLFTATMPCKCCLHRIQLSTSFYLEEPASGT